MTSQQSDEWVLMTLYEQSRYTSYADLAAALNEFLRGKYGEVHQVHARVVRNHLQRTVPSAVHDRRWLCAAVVLLGASRDQANRLLEQAKSSTEAARRELDTPEDEKHLWRYWPSSLEPGLRLLGVDPDSWSDDAECVIVLPVFEAFDGDQQIDTRGVAHCRHDILLAGDITRLFVRNGLRPPIIAKASQDFLERFAVERDFQILGERRVRYPIRHLICVGLFSNPFTEWFSDLDSRSFEMSNPGDRDDRSVTLPGQRRLEMSDPTNGDVGVLTRTLFNDITVNVIGGLNAIGTVRLGDFLGDRADELWAASNAALINHALRDRTDHDYCVEVRVPGTDDRWGFDSYHAQVRLSERHRKALSLYDLIGPRVIDLTDDAGSDPGTDISAAAKSTDV